MRITIRSSYIEPIYQRDIPTVILGLPSPVFDFSDPIDCNGAGPAHLQFSTCHAPAMLTRRFAVSASTARSSLLRSRGFAAAAQDDKRLNVALVGTGRMGQIRLSGLQTDPRVAIAAIIDSSVSGEVRAALERQYNTQVFGSVADAQAALAAKDQTLDGVWIATPTPTHLQLVQDCVNHAGSSLKAIGIEKPVGGSLQEIDDSYAACLQHRVQLFCSFQRRFDPSYQALRTACVGQTKIGKLQSIHTVFRDHPCPPIEFLKTGGDPFHDLAVHDIDYVCDLVGEYPTKVYASGTSLSPELRAVGVMDKASVWLEFPTTGVVCTMDLSRSAAYGYDQRVEVAGEFGMLQVQNPPKTALVHANVDGVTSDVLSYSFPDRFREAYLLEMNSFIEVIQGKQAPRVHWNASRMATVVAEAARIAAVEKKLVTIKYGKTRQLGPHADPLLECEYEY